MILFVDFGKFMIFYFDIANVWINILYNIILLLRLELFYTFVAMGSWANLFSFYKSNQ